MIRKNLNFVWSLGDYENYIKIFNPWIEEVLYAKVSF